MFLFKYLNRYSLQRTSFLQVQDIVSEVVNSWKPGLQMSNVFCVWHLNRNASNSSSQTFYQLLTHLVFYVGQEIRLHETMMQLAIKIILQAHFGTVETEYVERLSSQYDCVIDEYVYKCQAYHY